MPKYKSNLKLFSLEDTLLIAKLIVSAYFVLLYGYLGGSWVCGLSVLLVLCMIYNFKMHNYMFIEQKIENR